jgi:hypothetical protein
MRFAKDQKVALIGRSDRPTECYVEKATKTRLTIRFPNGHVSNTAWIVRDDMSGQSQTAHHARSSFMYYKEHVEPWTEKHDARVASCDAQQAAQRQLNAIRDRVSKLHISERDLIAKLAEVLLQAEGVA